MHFPADVKCSKERGVLMPTHGKQPFARRETSARYRKERNSLNTLFLPHSRQRDLRDGRSSTQAPPPGCGFSPAGRKLRQAEQQPPPWRAVPMDGSKSGTRTFTN